MPAIKIKHAQYSIQVLQACTIWIFTVLFTYHMDWDDSYNVYVNKLIQGIIIHELIALLTVYQMQMTYRNNSGLL